MVPYYYVRTQEKVEIALLDMFNNIVVNKYSDLTRTSYTKTLRVPIVINQDKNFANWFRNVEEKKRTLPIPLGGLRYVSMEPNNENRTQSTYARTIFSKATERWIQDIQPTPYKLTYDLEFLTDNLSDFHQIRENIVPYFNKARALRIKEFDFAPDLERKILVELVSVSDTFEDELESGSKHRFFKPKFTFSLHVDWYRPFEIPEMIKYAQMNIQMDDIMHSMQVFVYPDPIAQKEKKAWEEIDPSTRLGYSLLKTSARTLVKKLNVADGSYSWTEITVPDAIRPVGVPSFNLLHLNFDTDTSFELDRSGFNRDFVALNDKNRTFVPGLAPVNGQDAPDGYEIDPNVQWNKILNWFGTNNGLNESPFTFQSILQFKYTPVADTIFQYLANDATTLDNGSELDSGEVFFEWGIIDSRLYFTFKTHGTESLFYTYTTKEQLDLSNTDVYKFVFVLYDEGNAGVFGYTINDGAMIVLDTERT